MEKLGFPHVCSYITGMSVKKLTYKQGDRVEFAQVTRKYGCRGGIIKEKIQLYTDDTPKYPSLPVNHPHGGMKVINIYRNILDAISDKTSCRTVEGYIVDAIGDCGNHVETITVTDKFIVGAFS